MTIGRLQKHFAKGRTWDDLTPALHERWENVVWHNFHDCRGMRAVTLLAADEYAATIGEDRRTAPAS